jgi:hypothetical protein
LKDLIFEVRERSSWGLWEGRGIRDQTKYSKIWGGGAGAGRSEMAGNINIKLKSLYTFGYTVDLSAEISFFAMVHSTL